MLTSTEQKLLQTIQTVTSDADASAWEDPKNDALHIEATIGTDKRHVTFDHISKHDLADLDEKLRAHVIMRLLRTLGARRRAPPKCDAFETFYKLQQW